jgi:hypothetical protein
MLGRQIRNGCLVLMLVALAVGGCKDPSGAVKVSGKVTYQGAPIEKAALTLFPTTGRAVPVSVIGGEYSAELQPGDYTATLDVQPELPPGFKEGDPMPKPKYVLPEQYTVRAKSTLKATVTAGHSEPLNFELK